MLPTPTRAWGSSADGAPHNRGSRANARPPTMSIQHYENFPVASLLSPPAVRPAILAIYRYARTAGGLSSEATGKFS